MLNQHFIQPWLKLRVLGRANWILAATVLVNRMGHMALPFLTLYLTTSRGYSPSQAGLILSCYGICGLFGALASGFLSDRIPPLILMRSSLFLTAAVIAIFPFVESYPLMLVVIGFWALGTESYRPAANTIMNLITPSDQRKLANSLYRFAINLGMSLGPALGGFLAEKSFRSLFWVNSFALVCGSLILTQLPARLGRPSKNDLPPEYALTHDNEHQRAFKDKRFLLFLLGILCVSTVYMQHESVLGLYITQDLGLATRYFGLSFAVNTILIVLLEIPLNVKTLHWSHRKCLITGALIHAIAFGCMGFATGFVGIAALVAFYTFAEMIESPAVFASIGDQAPRKRMGEYSGMLTMTYSLSLSLAPWIGTNLYQHYGHQSVWIFCFILAGVAALIFSQCGWLKKAAVRSV